MVLVKDEDEDDDQEVGGHSTLFKKLVVFLSREVNVEVVLFILRACGCRSDSIGWDGPGSPFDRTHDAITHEIVDRPTQQKRNLSREYVHPNPLPCSALLLICS